MPGVRFGYLSTAALAAFTLCLLMPFASSVAQAGQVGVCQPTRIKYNVSGAIVSTVSKTYAAIPGASLSFTQGAGGGCVIVTFAAEAAAADQTLMHVRVSLDNDAVFPQPMSVIFVGDAKFYSVHTMQFIFSDIAPGPHKIKVLWASSSGGTVAMQSYTLTVQYK